MPSKSDLKMVTANKATDLRNIRLPGLDKSFEQLTISELVQLRPGSNVSDTYEVNAVTDNVSATTSAALEALGRVHKTKVMNQLVNQQRLNQLRSELAPSIGRVGGLSANEPPAGEVSMADPSDDVFKASDDDPFKA